MKMTTLVGMAILASTALSAQVDSTTKVMNSEMIKDNMVTINRQNRIVERETENSENTAVMMKDCKMMTIRAGKTMPMRHNVTMRNGTVVTTNGLVLDANGTTSVMIEGEHIDMYGKIVYSRTVHKGCKIN
jgi:hypothetical protein